MSRRAKSMLLASTLAMLACPALAKDPPVRMYWRSELVSCAEFDVVTKESAAAGLGAVLIERAFSVGFEAIRAAVKKAAEDQSSVDSASSPSYLFDRKVSGKGVAETRRRSCVVIAHGQDAGTSSGQDGQAAVVNAVSDAVAQAGIKSDLQLLRLKDADFMTKIAFEPSRDKSAVKTTLLYLYYPRQLYQGRRSANRTLNVLVSVKGAGAEGDDIYAGDVTLTDVMTSPKLITSGALLNGQSKIGWSPIAKVDLSEFSGVTTGPLFPVNLTAVVTETAQGSAFFKKLDQFLDDDTTKAISEAAADALMPHRRKALREEQKQSYRDSIVDYYAKSADFTEKCSELSADASSAAKRSAAWAAYYALTAAYRVMMEARTSGVDAPDLSSVAAPVMCK